MCSEICLRWGNISSFQGGDDFPLFLSIFPAASWHRQELHSTPQKITTQGCIDGCQEFLREPKGGGGSTVLANLPQLEAIKTTDFTWTVTDKMIFILAPSFLKNPPSFVKPLPKTCKTHPNGYM